MIVIINKNNTKKRPFFDKKIYCGRGSPLGNEFTHLRTSQFETTQVKDRKDACRLNKRQLLTYLLDERNILPKSQKVKNEMNKIYKMNKSYIIALECFCKNQDNYNGIDNGQQCHTEDIKDIIEKISTKDKNKSVKEILEEMLSSIS